MQHCFQKSLWMYNGWIGWISSAGEKSSNTFMTLSSNMNADFRYIYRIHSRHPESRRMVFETSRPSYTSSLYDDSPTVSFTRHILVGLVSFLISCKIAVINGCFFIRLWARLIHTPTSSFISVITLISNTSDTGHIINTWLMALRWRFRILIARACFVGYSKGFWLR